MTKKKETKVEVDEPQIEETVVMEEPVGETPKVRERMKPSMNGK